MRCEDPNIFRKRLFSSIAKISHIICLGMRGINLGLLLFLSLALSFSPRPGKARVTVQDYGNSSRFYLTSCRSTLVSPWPFEYELVNDTSQNSSIIASGHFVSSNAPSHLINGSIVFRWNEVIGVSVFLPGELLKLQRLGAKAVVLSTNFRTSLFSSPFVSFPFPFLSFPNSSLSFFSLPFFFFSSSVGPSFHCIFPFPSSSPLHILPSLNYILLSLRSTDPISSQSREVRLEASRAI